MFEKECIICGTIFTAKTDKRQYCDKCQKDSNKARMTLDKNILHSKRRLGELSSQQYHLSKCTYCGKEWQNYGRKVSFCSRDCLQNHTIETAVCRVCRKPLYSLGIIAKNGQGCCSEECSEQHRITVAKGKDLLCVCKVCKIEFIKKNAYLRNLCSKKCEERYDKFIARRNGKLLRCVMCNKEFIQKDLEDTCSLKCNIDKREDRVCILCGTEYSIHPDSNVKVCNKKCQTILDRQEAKVKKRDKENIHLCTECKTSQADCIYFTSKFIYHPKGSKTKVMNGKNVVLECPQYKK